MFQPQRKLNRWSDYDYNLEGYYFITICTQDRIEYFGEITNDEIILNQYGKITEKFWREIPNHYKNVAIDEFIIMPNHIHGIIVIKPVGTGHCPVLNVKSNDQTGHCPVLNVKSNDQTGYCPVPTGRYGLLSKIINSFKNVVIKQIHQQFNDYKFQWQRSFHDHIIRDEEELHNIREYIKNNPKMWARDRNKDV